MIKDFLEAGQIVGTHGIHGELRVNPWCDSPEFLRGFKELYFDHNGEKKVKVCSCRPHGNIALISLCGIDNVETAAAMRGKTLYIRRGDANLPADSYFIAELIGCAVMDADDAQTTYGILSDVCRTGAYVVWLVVSPEWKEHLVPAIPSVVIKTDVDAGEIRIRPIKGIFEDAN